MAIDRKVTVMCNTVRDVDPYRGGQDVLRCIAADLWAQTMPASDFEFIAVDGLYPYRADALRLAFAASSFRVTHIGPRQTAMVQDHRVAIAAYKNSGVVRARGELVVCVDDHCTLDPHYLERAWAAWHRDGVMLAALSAFADETGGVRINDSRVIYLDSNGRCVGPRGGDTAIPPQYGFCAVPLEAILAVNGWDEYFDGSQGIEDADFGIRLQKAGYRVGLDRAHFVKLNGDSTPHDARLFPSGSSPIVKCCQSTARIQWGRGHVRANTYPWDSVEWAKMTPCYLARGRKCSLSGLDCAYPDTFAVHEHEGLVALRNNPPVFDLREMRRATGNAP